MTHRPHFILIAALLLAACAPAQPPAELTETWTNDIMDYRLSYPKDMIASQSEDGACTFVRKEGNGPQPLLTVVFGSCLLHTDVPLGKQTSESVTVAALGSTVTTENCFTSYGSAEDRSELDVPSKEMHHKDCEFILQQGEQRFDWRYEIATKYGTSVSTKDMEHLSETASSFTGFPFVRPGFVYGIMVTVSHSLASSSARRSASIWKCRASTLMSPLARRSWGSWRTPLSHKR